MVMLVWAGKTGAVFAVRQHEQVCPITWTESIRQPCSSDLPLYCAFASDAQQILGFTPLSPVTISAQPTDLAERIPAHLSLHG